jgi:hypothetical protein
MPVRKKKQVASTTLRTRMRDKQMAEMMREALLYEDMQVVLACAHAEMHASFV